MTDQHTKLTLRNYFSYATLAFVIGLVTVGFGAVDLLMVGPLGIVHVAGVGQGDLIVSCLMAGFLGFVDVFAARFAAAEGGRDRGGRQVGLALGFLGTVVLCAVLAFALTWLVQPALVLMQQVDELVVPITDYVAHRLYGVAPFLVYLAASEALKISGQRTLALQILVAGLAANAGLNALFLYSPVSAYFASVESAVAVSTVLVHVAMAVAAAAIWLRLIGARSLIAHPDVWQHARGDLGFLMKTGPGISARLLNDYAGSVIPILFIGTMSTTTVAAAAIATKIYTIFCRVPQAAFSASFVYYSYGLEDWAGSANSQKAKAVIAQLRRYAAWPTAIALLVTLVSTPLLVRLFGGSELDVGLAGLLLLAYLLFVPLYFFEQFYGELLTAHAKAGLLFKASTAATYLITIPLAYFSVFYVESAFLAILGKGVAVAVLAAVYWVQFH